MYSRTCGETTFALLVMSSIVGLTDLTNDVDAPCGVHRRRRTSFGAVAWSSWTSTCDDASNTTTKNHAVSGSIAIACDTARFTDSMRSPAIEPDLSMMNPTTRGPLPPAATLAPAVTVRIASTRV